MKRSQIADDEGRSLSEVVREIIERELLYRQRRQVRLTAFDLQADYRLDPALVDFTALDGESFFENADE